MRKPFYWKARKTWYFRYRDNDGRLCGMPLPGTKKQAYSQWRQIIDEMERGDGQHTTGDLTVIETIQVYVASLQSRVDLEQIEPSTVDRRFNNLASFCAHIKPSLKISDLRPFHVDDWLEGQPRWNATTRHHAAETIKTAIKWAYDRGRIPKNPIRNLKIQEGPPRDFVVDSETYAQIIDGASDHKYHRRHVTAFKSYLILMHLTGCRPSEPIRVRIEDFDGETWTIPKHKTRRKVRRPRVVYLCPCAQTLSRIMAAGRKTGPLLRPEESRPWKYSDLRRRFERLRKRKKIDANCVLYSNRHTWITNAMIATGDVAAVAEMAGTSIQMIQQRYGHLSQRKKFLMKSAVKIAREVHQSPER